jgi:AraC-like DNA-binding protein
MFALNVQSVLADHMVQSASAGVDRVGPLFEQLPNIPFYVKDAALRIRSANAAMAGLCGARFADMLVGKVSADFFPEATASAFDDIERLTLGSGRAVRNRMLFATPLHGQPTWLLLGCFPILSERETIGVTGVGRILEQSERKDHAYERVADAARFIAQHLAARIRVSDLAHRAGVSISRMERDFVDVFGVPPNRYIANARLESAMDMLRQSADTIADIAHACGYADQSAFTRRFQAVTAMTPSEYRRRGLREAAFG